MAAEKGDPPYHPRAPGNGTARILDLLKAETHGLSISDISRKIDLNRSSVAKYLGMLVTAGRVEMYVIGSAKVYRISSRPSLLELFEYIQESVIIIDSDLTVRGINPTCCVRLGLEKDEIVDRAAASAPSMFLEKLVASEKFLQAVRGTEQVSEIRGDPGTVTRHLVTYIPVILFDGQHGVAIILRDAPEQSSQR